MSVHFIWKRLIKSQIPLLSHPLYICLHPPLAFHEKAGTKITHFSTQIGALSTTSPPLAFNPKTNTKNTHFCTQTAVPATPPLDWGTFREFLMNKCGLTEEDFTKVFGHRNRLPRISIHNLEEVLELLYGCGLTTRAQIRTVVLCNPRVLISISETKLKSMLSFLRTFMKEEYVSKLVYNYPFIFNCSEDRVRSTVSLLQKLGVDGDFLSELLARQPRLISANKEKVMESFKQAEDLGVKKGSKTFVAALPAILVGKETIDRRLQCLRSLGFSEKQIMEISSKKTYILGHSEEHMTHRVDFVVNSLGLPLGDLVKYPTLFTRSVEKSLIPRYKVIEALKYMQVLKTKVYLPTVFNLSETKFLEKYVNFNAESSTDLRDIYQGEKARKLIIDKETCSDCVSVKRIQDSCEMPSAASV